MNVTYPSRSELAAFAGEHKIPFEDVVRDVVRLIAIAHMSERDFLDENCVLTGGMALRLRGSNRFTIFDTDSSSRLAPVDEQAISDGVTLNADELEIEPADPTYWSNNKKIQTAKPITYKAYFIGGPNTIEGEFSLTVNQRGLNMEPEWFELRTPYRSLNFDPLPQVPVMHIVEQTAEKIVAWCGNSLAKHYVDLGWIASTCAAELDADSLKEQCEKKLETNRELFIAYRKFESISDLVEPLTEPDGYFGPQNEQRDLRAGSLQFLGSQISLGEAKALIAERLVPLLS